MVSFKFFFKPKLISYVFYKCTTFITRYITIILLNLRCTSENLENIVLRVSVVLNNEILLIF